MARNYCSTKEIFCNLPEIDNLPEINLKQEELEYARLCIGANADTKKGRKKLNEILYHNKSILKKIKSMKLYKRIKRMIKGDGRVNILIDNAGFVNKGAELMLCAVVEQVRQNIPNHRIVLKHCFYEENVPYCVSKGIVPLKHISKKTLPRIKHFIVKNLFVKRRYITPSEIDVILDAGGFQFGDQWQDLYKGTSDNSYLKSYYESFAKLTKKIIFLPQAFGAFEHPISKERMQIVYQSATLLYPREQTSFNYLEALFPNSDKIKLYPDFTCLLKPKVPLVELLEDNTAVVIVPNQKMITHSDAETASKYTNFLLEIIQFLQEKNEKIILLNHEGQGDEDILNEINEKLSAKLPVLTNLTALEVKAVIGRAKILISSRFHGVVSGLSQNVPTFCTSWSHKYQELLKDYQVSDNLLPVADIVEAKTKIEKALADLNAYKPKQDVINNLEQKTKDMWKEVFETMRK